MVHFYSSYILICMQFTASLRVVEEELYLEKKKREAGEAERAQLNAEKQRLEASKGQLTAQLRVSTEWIHIKLCTNGFLVL